MRNDYNWNEYFMMTFENKFLTTFLKDKYLIWKKHFKVFSVAFIQGLVKISVVLKTISVTLKWMSISYMYCVRCSGALCGSVREEWVLKISIEKSRKNSLPLSMWKASFWSFLCFELSHCGLFDNVNSQFPTLLCTISDTGQHRPK